MGIDSRAILTAIRHFGPERARKTAICAAETAGAGSPALASAAPRISASARFRLVL
jgi:hypothetical protein